MRVKEKIKAADNRKKAFAYLRKKGFKDHEIAGILGNFAHESGSKNLKVDAYNPDDMGKPSFGLAQWRGDRRERLKERQGDRMHTLEGQLDFLTWELNNTEKKAREALSKTKTAEEAALVFSNKFERPHKDYAHNDRRQEYAKSFYNSYGNEDKDVVYIQEDGKIKTIDKNLATTPQLLDSDKVKDNMSEIVFEATTRNIPDSNLTNLQDRNNNATFEEQKPEVAEQVNEEKETEKVNPWKEKLKEKVRQRNALVDLISSEGFDLQFIEEDRAKIPGMASMKDGGEVRTSNCGGQGQPPCGEKSESFNTAYINLQNKMDKYPPASQIKDRDSLIAGYRNYRWLSGQQGPSQDVNIGSPTSGLTENDFKTEQFANRLRDKSYK